MYVVGSGPAGVSCAMALLQSGAKVTMLDPGLELDHERSSQLARLRGMGPENWQSTDLAFLKEGISAGVEGIPLKYAYGSDFPYRDPGSGWQLELHGVEVRPSFAKGGLSTVWGAAVLPFRANDIHDWPIGDPELTPHYRAVLDFMPLAGCHDSLEEFFPLHSDTPQPLQLSSQAREFREDLCASSKSLQREGILHGGSRLAMRTQPDSHSPGCCYCGQCMYGCPSGLIYSTSHTLDMLREQPGFIYRKGVALDRVEENRERVTLFAHDVSTREPLQLSSPRVFLACGVLATTKILLESLEALEQSVLLKDCCYFLLPLLRFHAVRGAFDERLHTLAQLFLEILDPRICDRTVHLQVYTYNEMYSMALKQLFGPAFRLLRIPARQLLNRFLLVQGYLPSSHSPGIRAVLRRDPKSHRAALSLSPVANERTTETLKKVLRKLSSNRTRFKAIPLGPMLRPGKPGRSFHSGGTFPMQFTPGWLQSDRFGRPYGFSRVHAVDSTSFPSIPATTITLSVMANAHRIGSGVKDY